MQLNLEHRSQSQMQNDLMRLGFSLLLYASLFAKYIGRSISFNLSLK